MSGTSGCSSLKVIVVDDYQLIRTMIFNYLKAMGFEHVDVATSGQEAQDKLMQGDYDIAFLDWNMPGKSGYTVLQECRQNEKFNRTAFVIVTAESEERYIIEALKAGATSYITKPFSHDTFNEKVKQTLAWIQTTKGAQLNKTAS